MAIGSAIRFNVLRRSRWVRNRVRFRVGAVATGRAGDANGRRTTGAARRCPRLWIRRVLVRAQEGQLEGRIALSARPAFLIPWRVGQFMGQLLTSRRPSRAAPALL